jgi:hypothetical protein
VLVVDVVVRVSGSWGVITFHFLGEILGVSGVLILRSLGEIRKPSWVDVGVVVEVVVVVVVVTVGVGVIRCVDNSGMRLLELSPTLFLSLSLCGIRAGDRRAL